MGQDHRVDFRGVDRQRRPVAQAQFLQPLEQAAIDENLRITRLDQVLGPGHRARGAHECQFHAGCSLPVWQ